MKKFKSTKGITLISLVVTIIILLILAGVTITILIENNGLINRAKHAKIVTEIESIKEEIQADILDKQAENEGKITEDSLKNILEKYGTLSEEGEKLSEKVLKTTEKNYEINVSDIFSGTTDDSITEANAPNLDKIAQKTYVTWNLNEEGTEYEINDTQTTIPDDWYDYEKGKWANIKTSQNGLEAYWVWIPRYEYIVPNSETATEIEVKFIPTNQKKADKGYTIHPAFTNEGNGGFGELDGIWVAKFEANSNYKTETYNGDYSTLKVQVKYGIINWGDISCKDIFTKCRKMTSEGEVLAGSTVDSHMMKNTEWGAVAILSQSKYGIYNPESSTGENGDKTFQIWNNPSSSRITGSVGKSKDSTSRAGEYNSVNGPKASTTGTIYGIYDMAGGSWEYVAGCIKGKENSIFGITEEENKYVDLYTNSSNSYVNYDGEKIGDTTKETNGWNYDYSNFIYSSSPVFLRGR